MGSAGGRQAGRRCVTFLRVLTDLAGADEVRATLTDDTRPVVAAEHLVHAPSREGGLDRTSRTPARIDLLFEWPVGTAGQRAVVVVEAKLGSTVGDGQLRPYRIEAQRRAKGGPVALVLLTPWADGAEGRHRRWAAVRWFTLLRRWEAALAESGDADPEFARVRAHLWHFVLSNRRAQL